MRNFSTSSSTRARQLEDSTNTQPPTCLPRSKNLRPNLRAIRMQIFRTFSMQCPSPRCPLACPLFWAGWIWRSRLYLVSASLIFPWDSLQWHGQFNCLLLWWRSGIEAEEYGLLLEKYCRIPPSVNTYFMLAVAPWWFGEVRVSSRALLGVLSDEATARERFGPPWGFSSVTSHNCLTDQIYTVESML